MTSAYLCNFYENKVNDADNNDAGNYRINNNKTTASKCFDYKTEIIGSRPAENSILEWDQNLISDRQEIIWYLRNIKNSHSEWR